MHVADASARSFRDFAAILIDPLEITRAGLAVRGFHRDFPRALRSRLAVDFQRDQFPGEVLEVDINVAVGVRFLPVHGNEVVAGLHFQSRLRER